MQCFFLNEKKGTLKKIQIMITAVWGDICWDYCFLACLAYEDKPNQDQQNNMSNFFTYLIRTLPCYGCQSHAIAWCAKNPPRVESKTTLVEWLVNFHNMVNVALHKETMTVNEATAALMKRMAAKLIARNKNGIVANNNNEKPNDVNAIPNTATASSNETLYFGFMITFVILFGIFLIAFIVVALQKRQLTKQLQSYKHANQTQTINFFLKKIFFCLWRNFFLCRSCTLGIYICKKKEKVLKNKKNYFLKMAGTKKGTKKGRKLGKQGRLCQSCRIACNLQKKTKKGKTTKRKGKKPGPKKGSKKGSHKGSSTK